MVRFPFLFSYVYLTSKSVLMLKKGVLTTAGDLIKPEFPVCVCVMVLPVKLAEAVPLDPIVHAHACMLSCQLIDETDCDLSHLSSSSLIIYVTCEFLTVTLCLFLFHHVIS